MKHIDVKKKITTDEKGVKILKGVKRMYEKEMTPEPKK